MAGANHNEQRIQQSSQPTENQEKQEKLPIKKTDDATITTGEVAQEKEKVSKHGEVSVKPSPLILQQQLQIHDEDTASTFWEKHDKNTTGSDPEVKRIPPSPSEVTLSTVSNSISIAFTSAQMEEICNLMRLHIDLRFLEFQNHDGHRRQRA